MSQREANYAAIIKQQVDQLLLAFPALLEDDILRADMIEAETSLYEFLRMIERKREDALELIDRFRQRIEFQSSARIVLRDASGPCARLCFPHCNGPICANANCRKPPCRSAMEWRRS